MSPGRYTELFFLDEAVACAAGHRPCAECRRPVWRAFQDAWAAVHGPMRAAEIDRTLHQARTNGRALRRHVAQADTLPEGAMMMIDDCTYLVRRGQALRWQPQGYGAARPLPGGYVTVLTPAPLLSVMQKGWRPELHETALFSSIRDV